MLSGGDGAYALPHCYAHHIIIESILQSGGLTLLMVDVYVIRQNHPHSVQQTFRDWSISEEAKRAWHRIGRAFL